MLKSLTHQSPIFRKLFLSACLVIAATLVFLDFYLTRYMVERQVESVEQRLAGQARVLAGEAADTPRAQLENWAHQASARAEARVTVINPAGVVLADSQHDPETMENHANRPEIREALGSGMGSSVRHSATLNRDLCYLALHMNYHGQSRYVLRLAVPLEDINAAVTPVRWRILGASLAAALLALGIAYFFSRSLTRRIDRLRTFAENLVDPRVTGTLLADQEDELGVLARSLGRMATQLRELVERLSLESARRQAILAGMVEGVLAVDHQLRVIFCNDAFAHTVGARTPAPEGAPLAELVRDPGLMEMLTRVLASGECSKKRLELPQAAGRVFEVQAVLLNAPSHRGVLTLLHDITDLERLERVRRDFVANVSHELRTPLTAIRGYAETLLEGALEDPEYNRRFVEIIKAHAERLNNISSDLLTLSDLESGRLPAEAEHIGIREPLEAAVHTLESEARSRGVTISVDGIEDAQVAADRGRLEQALINLLDNAIKFNHRGGEVHVKAGPTNEGAVRIAIADTGIGIPSEDHSRIFERFYRVDKARSREMGGTGLGLSIVNHIVERSGGSVSVESSLGKGSTFTILLPAA